MVNCRTRVSQKPGGERADAAESFSHSMEGGLIPSEGRTDKKYIVQNPNKPQKRKQRVGLMNGDKNAIINSQSKMRQKNERKRNKEEMR